MSAAQQSTKSAVLNLGAKKGSTTSIRISSVKKTNNFRRHGTMSHHDEVYANEPTPAPIL